jgi:hypothetical protein
MDIAMRYSVFRLAIALIAAAISICSGIVVAQQAPSTRVRGELLSAQSETLNIKSRAGTELQVKFDGKTSVVGLRKIALSDLAVNSFVGVAAVPGKDDEQVAVSIHVFPESSRGFNEGSRPYDLKPGSSMTNGALAERVKLVQDDVLVVKYKDGEKRFVVTPETSLVAFEPGQQEELISGAKVVATVEDREDGTRYASRILVGRNGLAPAM